MTAIAASPRPDTRTFRYKPTGRLWRLDGQQDEGPIRLTGEFFGPDDYVRVYVTPEELNEEYEPFLAGPAGEA